MIETRVMSSHCHSCDNQKKKKKTAAEFQECYKDHEWAQVSTNHDGSAGAMEPGGTQVIGQRWEPGGTQVTGQRWEELYELR